MSKLADSFFVEFIGVPGSGKSTLSYHVTKKLKEEGLLLYSPTFRINEELSLHVRSFYKLFYTSKSILWNLDYVNKYIEYIRYHNVNLKLLINWLYVKGLTQKYSQQRGITLYDQGLVQALWSFVLSESEESANFFRNLLFKEYPNDGGLIVCVEANDEIVKDRLSQRTSNNSRVDADSNAKFTVDEALQAYMKVKKTVDSLIDSRSAINKLTLINEKKIDLEKNVEVIVNKIKIDLLKA